ncbi:DegT/DnrJ/EryC1/StrS family aminotransferase [Algibacter sp. 2305UL17-15]|uniref:DegT/DnrJ/EryC1/StrS family aminotransferase n=1 Tax=Algibacter sp. 2305UL17-15 TaxID=3231268 RepID=UPI00345AB02A
MIKFLDLKSVNQRYENDLKNAFSNFLENGQYILGSQVLEFEQAFANYCGTRYCLGVSNGLDAITLIFEAYKTLGLMHEGDEVIVPANTYIASVLAISNAGLKPVLVAPDSGTFNIDVSKIEAKISSKTKAILGVHLYGKLYDVKGLEQLAAHHNLVLIEDAAQAHGAVFKDRRKAGNLSEIAAFSFYPTKNLGAFGDAGAITTNDKKLYDTIAKLRDYGRNSSYENKFKGFNCRLDELQAAFLNVKLKHLDSENQKQKELAKIYLEHINSEKIILPKIDGLAQHVFHQFVIKCEARDQLKSYLYENGVETSIHYPVPIHKQVAYSEFSDLKLPISEKLSQTILSLPLNSSLTKNDIMQIISLINSF